MLLLFMGLRAISSEAAATTMAAINTALLPSIVQLSLEVVEQGALV